MLSVLSVAGVETRIGEVAGVESVTVNHAAGNATVRYDETRLDVADIKAQVRQSGYEEDGAPPGGFAAHGHDMQAAPAETPGAKPKTSAGANDAAGGNRAASSVTDPSAPAAKPPAPAKPSSPASGAVTVDANPAANSTAASDATPPGDASKGKSAPTVT